VRAFLCRIDAFWTRHPALFVGTSFFLGCSCALNYHLFSFADLFLLPLLIFAFPHRRLLWGAALACVALCATSFRVEIPKEPASCHGVLRAEVVDRHLVTLHGRQVWKSMLMVHSFRASDGRILLKGVTVPISLPSPCSLVGGNIYQVNARLNVDEKLMVRLRPCIGKEILPRERTVSFVEWRLCIKRALERMFVRLFPDHEIRQVAGGLTFGLYKNPLLQQAMHRAGVEHVLAVSGFHFGIVAALTVFLSQGMAPKHRALLAMICLTVYLLIIGPLPSVVRAWCAAMVVLGGECFNRRTSGANCLGVGLIAAVFYDPSSVTGIGFQLSFLATAAILFFSRPVLDCLRSLFPSRQIHDVVQFSKADQGVLLMLGWFLPALSLLIPVFVVVCPYQLAFLQDFSLLGLVYNLLIPSLFSLAMPAVLLSVLFYPLPYLPQVCAFVAEFPLRLGLLLIENAPETTWGMVAGGVIPSAVGRSVLFLVFLAGMALQECEDAEHTDAWKSCL
jgi:competence protein ComEC